ncbi:ARHGAP19 [Mytilus coruscus]|uniref:ARHGAP19 n=1 Tax=Mytilus coruscus TaxID=42192 RepID=A0A6J8D922_MYTCO|nr:ARHGAP19 [Mytilus coruscus]
MDYKDTQVMKYRSFRVTRNTGSPAQSVSRQTLSQNRRTRFQPSEKHVCRLQNCMPLKFKEFVKSHLSSILELPLDHLETLMISAAEPVPQHKTPISFSKRKAQKQSMFGSDLSPENIATVLQLINYLSQDDVISTEGLFRKTGNICRQKQLKAKLDSATLTQKYLSSLTPHDSANVLKRYIHNLPEPLLTRKFFNLYVHITNISKSTKEETKSAKIQAIRLVIHLLPSDNLNLLKPLMTLLNKTASVSSNLMTAYSLGILFAPHLLCDRHSSADNLHSVLPKVSDLVSIMIEIGPQIFSIPKDLSRSVANFWREMEIPNQLYYKTVQETTDAVVSDRTSPKVHVVDLCDKPTATSPQPVPFTPPTTSRKRLSSDTSDGIPEKRPTPEMFLSPACNVLDFKPKLSKQTNSIIFHTAPVSSSKKPVARVKPIQHSPISQFLKSVPLKLQRVMSTPRSRAPMALFQSPSHSVKF